MLRCSPSACVSSLHCSITRKPFYSFVSSCAARRYAPCCEVLLPTFKDAVYAAVISAGLTGDGAKEPSPQVTSKESARGKDASPSKASSSATPLEPKKSLAPSKLASAFAEKGEQSKKVSTDKASPEASKTKDKASSPTKTEAAGDAKKAKDPATKSSKEAAGPAKKDVTGPAKKDVTGPAKKDAAGPAKKAGKKEDDKASGSNPKAKAEAKTPAPVPKKSKVASRV